MKEWVKLSRNTPSNLNPDFILLFVHFLYLINFVVMILASSDLFQNCPFGKKEYHNHDFLNKKNRTWDLEQAQYSVEHDLGTKFVNIISRRQKLSFGQIPYAY